MLRPAHAKVNLYLHVTGRRPDGYHLLDSLAVFADVHDGIEALPARGLTLAIDGPFAAALQPDGDNLVTRAARLLADATASGGAALRLTKRLPVASGIGGGSADAAATLVALCDLWGADPALLPGLAALLGADVPVCLASRAARMGGIGEVLAPAPRLPRCGLVLVNPGVAVATPSVFAARRGDFTPPAELPEAWDDACAMADALRGLRNDLQAPAIGLCPPIADVLALLASDGDTLLARMSGSGATCFALCGSPVVAAAAAARLAAKAPAGWWCWGGGLR